MSESDSTPQLPPARCRAVQFPAIECRLTPPSALGRSNTGCARSTAPTPVSGACSRGTTASRRSACGSGQMSPEPTATAAMVEWETSPLDPTWKGCGTCREDALGARVGIRPKVALLTLDWQLPEGIVVRVCSNCGHITTMGPIRPDIAAEWPVRNGR